MVAKEWPAGDDLSRAMMRILAASDPIGSTVDEIADAFGPGTDSDVMQENLEDLVGQGILDRRGVGRGALYTLSSSPPTTAAPLHVARPAGHDSRMP